MSKSVTNSATELMPSVNDAATDVLKAFDIESAGYLSSVKKVYTDKNYEIKEKKRQDQKVFNHNQVLKLLNKDY